MVGGHEESVERLAPILDVLAPPDGWRHFGDAGAGHFVKMVHNGVEYGIMQAYADRKSTRLNSSHANISYAVFCLKKKKSKKRTAKSQSYIDNLNNRHYN